ncbi:MAG: hypothetical protein U5R46_17580 [Gammaproteobacteria bacterium]|nr:hypothetical protein [Gammaproteobacteria bacterium]
MDSIVVAFPVIVIDGRLYKAFYDEKNAEMELVETEYVRLHWRGAERYRLHSTIDIVSKDYVDTLAKQRKQEIGMLMDVMEEKIKELHRCIEKSSLRDFEITEGSRGVVGTPPFIYELNRYFHTQTSKVRKEDKEEA